MPASEALDDRYTRNASVSRERRCAMPYALKKSPRGGYDIVKKDSGKRVGHSDTKTKAQASIRARHAGSNR